MLNLPAWDLTISVFVHLYRDTAKCTFLLHLGASLTPWHCSVPVVLMFVSVVQNVFEQGIISPISEEYNSWRHWGFPTPCAVQGSIRVLYFWWRFWQQSTSEMTSWSLPGSLLWWIWACCRFIIYGISFKSQIHLTEIKTLYMCHVYISCLYSCVKLQNSYCEGIQSLIYYFRDRRKIDLSLASFSAIQLCSKLSWPSTSQDAALRRISVVWSLVVSQHFVSTVDNSVHWLYFY